MTTSTLHSRLYPEPSPPSNLSNTTLMQMLHLRDALAPTATSVPAAPSCTKPAPSSRSWRAPYLHRVFWMVSNAEGQFLAAIEGQKMHFVHSPNAVPPEHRFCSFERAKSVWLELRELLHLQNCSLAIMPVDFYAHCSTPTLWCASND